MPLKKQLCNGLSNWKSKVGTCKYEFTRRHKSKKWRIDLVQKEYKEGDVIYISSDDEDEVLSVSSGGAILLLGQRKQGLNSLDAHSEARDYIKPSHGENIANNARETAAKLSLTERVVLSEQQEYVLRKVLQGESVFFTGSAGDVLN